MEIKNIQEYRSFYKNNIRNLPSRDEHFIGNFMIEKETSNRKYGWFEIYHGDKEGFGTAQAGIENFLQSFLDMARDGQAVYEFLQNAVDAGSTHFTMIWGKDKIDGNHYLLVANNGNMFNLNSVRSILNVGSSTKTADSLAIGKFGIGFKLAHRLVGKDNGLQELISENSGPILFSWKNHDIEKLAKATPLKPTQINFRKTTNGNFEIEDSNPWLFKILITCFPCLPENDLVSETPIMVDGATAVSTPFSKSEYEVLSRWVKDNQAILSKDKYSEGALFFLKLGAGKESELAEINLSEGVKFALAILKETADSPSKKDTILHTVQINDEQPITYPQLEYIKLTIDKEVEPDTYAYIRFGVDKYEQLSSEQKRKIVNEGNIESLFGFKKYNEIGDFFKGAPNFYLFFPLSEEVHNFNYILHSNAFYKGSSRTFLHKGSSKEDGINERLLKTITDKIDIELHRLSSSQNLADRQLFLHFYAALLTSKQSLNHDRSWIDEPYINRINKLLRKYIPVRNSMDSDDFIIISNPKEVFIKKTQVDVDPHSWGLKNVNWFYWGYHNEAIIRFSAISKLDIREFQINNLLSFRESISIPLNNWIGNDDHKIKIILQELAPLETTVITETTFKKNLFNVKMLKFNNDELLSINEFQEKEKDGYFIIYNTLNDIKNIFQKLGLKYTKENFDDYNFQPKYFNLFTNESQVRNYTILTRFFSKVVKDEKLNTLNKEEKNKIFEAFRTLNDNPKERMGELKLLRNNNNHPVCFKNLYADSSVGWIKKFCITNTESDTAYKNYLLNNEEELYQGIIYPFWNQILEYIITNPDKAEEVLNDIVRLYEKSNWPDKGKHLLRNWKTVIFKSESVESETLYFDGGLIEIPNQKYAGIQDVALAYFGVHIPDKYMMSYLGKAPFSYSSSKIEPAIKDTICSTENINSLLLLSQVCNIDFFGHNCIIPQEGNFLIDSSTDKKQIYTSKPAIVDYLCKYYPDGYMLIPEEFNEFRSKIELSESVLVEHLIGIFNEEDFERELDLIDVILKEGYDNKKNLIEKITYIILDATWNEERQNELYIRLLKDVTENLLPQEDLMAIHNKIKIINGNQEIIIGDIDSAHDSIKVKRGDKEIILSQSQILNLENADNIKFIQRFHDEALRRELLSQTIAHRLFKISNIGITDEMVARFNNNLSENKLVNAHQILFVLLSGKFSDQEINNYIIKFKDDQWHDLTGQIIIFSEENQVHIQDNYILHQDYTGFQNLLQLNDFEAFCYSQRENDVIASHFIFTKGFTAEMLGGTGSASAKLDYLYKGWSNLPANTRVSKREQDWAPFLGISTNLFVLDGIYIQNEILPEEFIKWTQGDRKKEELLRAIDVNVGDSPIEKLRKYLTGELLAIPDNVEIEKISPLLLLNTTNGLAGSFSGLKNQSVIFDESKHFGQLAILERIINIIADSELPKFPVIIHHTTNSFRVLDASIDDVYRIDETLHTNLKTDINNKLHLLYKAYNILRPSFIHNETLENIVIELDIEQIFIPDDTSREHDEPFYHNWKKENNIQLFKEKAIRYDIFASINNQMTCIGSINDGKFFIDESDDLPILIHYIQTTSLEDLSIALSVTHSAIAEAINQLIANRNKMLASFYNTLNAAGQNEVSNAQLNVMLTAMQEGLLKQQREELIEDIKTNRQYSYIWFESYLKFLLTYENKQDTISQKTISFQSIKRYMVNDKISDKFFLLTGANTLIPLSIEEFKDFRISLSIRGGQQNEHINVEMVTKKGQDLLIFCRESISSNILERLSDVIQVKISFSPVIDLLERLYKSFTNSDNLDEWDEINDTLPELHFIYGPPGTGKTTTFCQMILDNVQDNYKARHLILTPTNKAADVLCKKLLIPSGNASDVINNRLNDFNIQGRAINVCRLGKPTDPELEDLGEELYQSSLTTQHLDYNNVLASTIHRIPYYDAFNEKENERIEIFKMQDHWDYVIFDEASMTNLPYLVFSILAIFKFNPQAKFIIAGDPKQIPPVVEGIDKELEELDIQDENVYTMMGINSFQSSEQKLRDGDTIQNLDRQYRSVKEIGKLFSELSYNDLLKHDREEKQQKAKPLPEAFRNLINGHVTYIDFPLNNDHSIFRVSKLLYSSYHIYSALFAAELIRHFDSLLSPDERWTIGLIAPYKAQAVLLSRLMDSYGISNKIKVYADTVHGFQGDECDMVFFISNPNNTYYTGHRKALLSKEYIYNVAISRARDYLIILHPFTTIGNNPFINSLVATYEKNFKAADIRQTATFEKIIFNQEDHIPQNSFVTGHDNINIFGQMDMKYYIKASESAIDIQLRKL